MFKSILVELQLFRKGTLKRKNRKLETLIDNKHRERPNSYVLPLINSPWVFEYVLHQSFIDKNKYIKCNIVIELEALAST